MGLGEDRVTWRHLVLPVLILRLILKDSGSETRNLVLTRAILHEPFIE
jgi:hypothetical protein